MTETHPAPDFPRTRIAAVVFNPIKVDLAALQSAVSAAETESGWGTTLWFETSEDDAGQGPTAEALEAGASMVIVAGGDGTVRAVAEAIHESSASLAILPSGTGNLLARNLNLTLNDVPGALRTAFAGTDRQIDLGIIDIRRDDESSTRHAFAVMAGLGLDAKMLVKTDDDLKKKIGWLAYGGAILAAVRDTEELHGHYRLEKGENRSLRAHTVIVGNCGSLQGGIRLLPEAKIDDGIFDIVLLRPRGFVGWVTITSKIIWENGVLRRTETGRKLAGLTKDVRALRYIKGRELTLDLDRAHDIELDGDTFGTARGVTTWIAPKALTVRVPADT